jgi:hypothetical protein
MTNQKTSIDSSMDTSITENVYLLPSELETQFLSRLEKIFGEDGAKAILRMIRAIIIRRLHSVLLWGNWMLSKLDIGGIRTRVSFSRYYGDLVYEISMRVSLEDLDPMLIRRNIGTLYKMAKMDMDIARTARDIDAVVGKFIQEELLREEEFEQLEEQDSEKG